MCGAPHRWLCILLQLQRPQNIFLLASYRCTMLWLRCKGQCYDVAVPIVCCAVLCCGCVVPCCEHAFLALRCAMLWLRCAMLWLCLTMFWLCYATLQHQLKRPAAVAAQVRAGSRGKLGASPDRKPCIVFPMPAAHPPSQRHL